MRTSTYTYLVKGNRFFFSWVKDGQMYYLAGNQSQHKRYEIDSGSNAYNLLVNTINRYVLSGFKPATPPAALIEKYPDADPMSFEHCSLLAVVSKGLKGEHFDAIKEKISDLYVDLVIECDFSEVLASITITDPQELCSLDFGNMSSKTFNKYSETEKEFMLEKKHGDDFSNNPNGDGSLHYTFGEKPIMAILLVVLKQLHNAGADISVFDAGINYMNMDEPWTVFSTLDWYPSFEKSINGSPIGNPHFVSANSGCSVDVSAWL